jgi:4-amino-4-deoxy-L-arabinose transferase-like glycosyltransferase
MRPVAAAAASWTVVLGAAMAALAYSGYTTRDPDSTCYAGISAHLSTVPFRDWIAPQWWGAWENEGPFREHPIGIFILPALIAKAGYAPLQAAYAAGALYSIGALLMLRRVAAAVAERHEAAALQWAVLLMPIAFVYRIRANQEYPILLLLLACLYGIQRVGVGFRWTGVAIAGAVGLMLVKGIFVIFAPIACALWWLLAPPGREEGRRTWLTIALMMAVLALVAAVYEWAYRASTGDSFLAYYVADRLRPNAGLTGPPRSPSSKAFNLLFYGGRLLWFAAPGSVLAVAATFRRIRASDTMRNGLGFAMALSVVYVLAMSAGANRADRFIFPAYFAIGTAGAVAAMRRWPKVDGLAQRLAALPPSALPLFWFGLFLLTFLTSGKLRYVRF